MKVLFVKYTKIVQMVFPIIVTLFGGCVASIPNDNNLEALQKEYIHLRARQKALKPGVFDKELSDARGRLKEILSKLGQQLGKPEYRQQDIIRIMGEPDAIMVEGEYQPGSLGHSAPGGIIPKDEVHIVYFWRGWHDYLYFVIKGGVIQQCHWYFAGE
jgi:hypothetical protein